MFRAISLLLFVLVFSDVLVVWQDLPVPGPAIGLAIFFALFCLRGGPDRDTARLFELAAPHVALFFVPAAVGVVANFDEITRSWLSIVAAIVGSTALTLMVTGHVAQALLRRFDRLRGPVAGR